MMRRLCPFALLFALAVAALAQPSLPPVAEAERGRWFRDAKFGIMFAWGPYSLIGRHEWIRHQAQIPQAAYDEYARKFNPVRFNADTWVDLAKAAGAKYIVITSKHHDGFSIYRSRVSAYDMEMTPYAGDPLKLLAASARRKALPLGLYHSIMDWHYPDYRPRRAWEYPGRDKEGGNNNRYVDFMKAQLRELLTQYGDVATLWFDGEWEHTLAETGRADEVYQFVHSLQPNALINDRLFERRPGSKADFATPDQYIPAQGVLAPNGKPVPWEASFTINEESWAYNRYETAFKTERELIRLLVEVASKGGNLLLIVGPKPDGTIPGEFVSRLNAVGRWLSVNGEAIYGSTASPFDRLPFFGQATAKGNKLYLHLFDWPAGGTLRVPALRNLVHSARLLADPSRAIPARRDGDDVVLRLSGAAPDDVASVIELTLDGEAVAAPFVNRAAKDGVITLGVESCRIETEFDQRASRDNALGHVFLSRWTRDEEVPHWTLETQRAGRYRVEISYSSRRTNAEFSVEIGRVSLPGKTVSTGNEWVFQTHTLGEVELRAGQTDVRVHTNNPGGASAMSLERVLLRPLSP